METAKKITSLDALIPNKENPEYLCNFKEDDWTFDYFAHITGQKNLIVFFFRSYSCSENETNSSIFQ